MTPQEQADSILERAAIVNVSERLEVFAFHVRDGKVTPESRQALARDIVKAVNAIMRGEP